MKIINPFVHSPDFDLTTLGTTAVIDASTSTSDSKKAWAVVPAADGNFVSIGLRYSGATTNIMVAIYADNAGSAGALLGVGSSQNGNTTGYEFKTFTLDAKIPFTKGTTYWVSWVPSGDITTLFHNLYGISTVYNAANAFEMIDPFGAQITGIDSFTVFANVEYDPSTYNYVLNERFENWTASDVPDGWTLNFTPDANNFFEENVNGMRLVSNNTVSIKKTFLTALQDYHVEMEVYSLVIGGVKMLNGGTFHVMTTVGKRFTTYNMAGTELFIYRNSTVSDLVIRSLKVWQ